MLQLPRLRTSIADGIRTAQPLLVGYVYSGAPAEKQSMQQPGCRKARLRTNSPPKRKEPSPTNRRAWLVSRTTQPGVVETGKVGSCLHRPASKNIAPCNSSEQAAKRSSDPGVPATRKGRPTKEPPLFIVSPPLSPRHERGVPYYVLTIIPMHWVYPSSGFYVQLEPPWCSELFESRFGCLKFKFCDLMATGLLKRARQ